MADPNDGSPEGTALREAREELGVKSCDVEVLGQLSSFPDQRKASLVTPVLGCLSKTAMDSMKINPAEVGDCRLHPPPPPKKKSTLDLGH